MKNKRLASFIILLVTISTLSGCFWPRYDERGGHRGEGEHHSAEGERR
jgi:hypothetical protein